MKKVTMTKREKALLFLLAFLGFSFLSYRFLLKPLYDYQTSQADALDAMLTQQMMVQMRLSDAPNARTRLETAKGSQETLQSRYPAEMPNEAITMILTDLYTRNGLSLVNMSISPAHIQPEGVTAYTTASATLTLSGSYASLRNLIDETEATDYIRIRKLSFSHERGLPAPKEGTPTGEKFELTGVALYFEVTMLAPPPEVAEESPQDETAG